MRIEGELRFRVSAADLRRLLMHHVEQNLRSFGIDPNRFNVELDHFSVIEQTVTAYPRLEVDGSPAQPSLAPSDDHPVPSLYDLPPSFALPEE